VEASSKPVVSKAWHRVLRGSLTTGSPIGLGCVLGKFNNLAATRIEDNREIAEPSGNLNVYAVNDPNHVASIRNPVRRSSGLSAGEHYELWAALAIESFERELEAFYRRAQFVIV
jgi:hypothetical protein